MNARDDRHITVITGASKGIGRATAERLAARGHLVVGLARNTPEGEFPGEFIPVDLADRAASARVFTEIAERHAVDCLLNNVGLVHPQLIDEVDIDDMHAVLDVNLRPAVQATQAFLPAMRAKGWGRIVNISSLTVVGIPARTSYAAAKAGMISFTRGWAVELAKDGITVNAVAPGPIETELFRSGNPVGSESERRFLNSLPIGRIGQPAEVAAAIAYFMSDEAGFTTGQTLFVDGGASIG
jgi:NAD(P)-dependent dehydrogenase (short-subunit alcohol dehydrogenase family)